VTTTEHHVRPGQVWADNDARSEGRTLRVERIEIRTFGELVGDVPLAVCTVLTPPDNYPQGRVGKQVTIRVSRMRSTSNGYRLVTDVPA
jgi:hypothetical protein